MEQKVTEILLNVQGIGMKESLNIVTIFGLLLNMVKLVFDNLVPTSLCGRYLPFRYDRYLVWYYSVVQINCIDIDW